MKFIHKSYTVTSVLFDFDGTLTQPGVLDFPSFKKEIECPEDRPVLEYILDLPESAKHDAMNALDRFEMMAAELSKPNRGAEKLITALKTQGLKIGIISRNSHASIRRALQNFNAVKISDFDIVVSRNTPVPFKPEPDGLFYAADKLGTNVSEMLVVGDFDFDIEAGRQAGAITVFLDVQGTGESYGSDFCIGNLDEIREIVRMGTPLKEGKFPNDLLSKWFSAMPDSTADLIIPPSVGEDIAAVDIQGQSVLILKSDPITFATEAIAQYTVIVNANDIATSGATPKWMLTTLMLPPGTTPSWIYHTLNELMRVCMQYGIVLCGGHTEITDAVNRPVITGMLAGTVARDRLVDKRNMRPGDKVILTKAAAVEGTSIIARELEERLIQMGMDTDEIETCKGFLSNISILKEAKIAAKFEGVHAMHDVTEGGIATALEEFSIAGNLGIRIDMDKIPVFDQTRQICRLFDIDPLGLIGSGSLLIACRADVSEKLTRKLHEHNIQALCVGEVIDAGSGIQAMKNGMKVHFPSFEADEIARLFNRIYQPNE